MFKEEGYDAERYGFVSLRDLLEQRGVRHNAPELAKRIRLNGVWTWNETGELIHTPGDSEWGRRATRCVNAVIWYDTEVRGGPPELFYEHMEPVSADDGPDDQYCQYGWPADELKLPLVEAKPQLSSKQQFDRRMQPVLDRLETRLAERGISWDRSSTVPGTVGELYEFACWLDPDLRTATAFDTFRKKCRGLVDFKVGRRRLAEDDAGNRVPEPVSPLGEILKREGLRCQADLEPSASPYR